MSSCVPCAKTCYDPNMQETGSELTQVQDQPGLHIKMQSQQSQAKPEVVKLQ